MKYFIDTEFIEGPQDKRILGITYGKTKPTIDLISIGIVREDNQEYYAISKDFNLTQAWNNTWVKENVLKPIFWDLHKLYIRDYLLTRKKEDDARVKQGLPIEHREVKFGKWDYPFTIKGMRGLLDKYGKTNKEIAQELEWFIRYGNHIDCNSFILVNDNTHLPIEFYAYYADYDWVVFCQLFGTMNDLPKGFPVYCIDLKQELDRQLQAKLRSESIWYYYNTKVSYDNIKLGTKLREIQKWSEYPAENNNHHALADAKWNYELYKFLQLL